MKVRAGSSPVIRTKQYKSEPYANRRRVRICSFSERFIKWKMRVVLSTTLILRWFILIVQSSTFRRLLCLLRFHRSWLCPEARFSPMHPLRLPICPKSFRTACLFQPRKINFVLLSFFEGDESINERLFTQLYFKLFSIICQTFLNGCKSLIFYNLKFRP